MVYDRLSRYNKIQTGPSVARRTPTNARGAFFASRLYDVGTTLLFCDQYGFDPALEANPVMRALMKHGLGYFVIYEIVIALWTAWLFPKCRLGRISLSALTIISFLVGTSNLLIFLVVR